MSGHSAPGSEGPLTIFSTVASQHRVTIQYGEKDTPLNLPSAFVDFVLLDAGEKIAVTARYHQNPDEYN